MRIQQKEVFQFAELSDQAKDAARRWWLETHVRDGRELLADLTDDFESVASILGIEFNAVPVRLMGGGTRYKPEIYFSGFSSQGDGACFAGTYSYKKGSVKAIHAYAPLDKDLHDIANMLATVQKKNFYSIRATVDHTGRYYHDYSTTIDIINENRDVEISDADKDIVKASLRHFMRWMYDCLEEQNDYLESDEHVEHMIFSDEIEFYSDGSPVQ